MDADLDLLLTTVFVTADDLLPERAGNAHRRVTDAEVVTLCVAQSIMGYRRIGGFSRGCQAAGPSLSAAAQAAWVSQAATSFGRVDRAVDGLPRVPDFHDDLLLIDSTPVECAAAARRSSVRFERHCRRLAPIRQRIESTF